MGLLHIFDSSDMRIRQTVNARSTPGTVTRLPVSDGDKFADALDSLVSASSTFDRVLFETHGGPGLIEFGGKSITADWWRWAARWRKYTRLTTAGARVYFNGCNVSEGPSGWDFLEAAAAVFLTPGGGTVFGQTSVGFGNPFNGHVVHFWGSTRTLFVARDGRIIKRLEE